MINGVIIQRLSRQSILSVKCCKLFKPYRGVYLRSFGTMSKLSGGVPFRQEDLLGDEKYNEESRALNEPFEDFMQQDVISHNKQEDIIQKPIDLSEEVKKLGPRIFVSEMSNPYNNLALEHYIFKHFPVSKGITENSKETNNRLVIYINSPCVVIGKNQNPWGETNLPIINSLSIPLVRRFSGGGAVVHDTENVNFSIMMPRNQFTRDKHSQLICDEVNKLPLDKQITRFTPDTQTPYQVQGPHLKLKLNQRFDIVDSDSGYKVSGSAYKIQKDKAYHHATMLINSKLDILKTLLHRNEDIVGKVDGRGVESVKVPVKNVGMDKKLFIECVIDAFTKEYGKSIKNEIKDEDDDDLFGLSVFQPEQKDVPLSVITEDDLNGEVQEIAKSMQTWDWKFGSTPLFHHTLTNLEHDFTIKFTVEKGIIQDLEIVNGEDAIINGFTTEQIFSYLKDLIKKSPIRYQGKILSPFITDENIANWIGNAIDGTS